MKRLRKTLNGIRVEVLSNGMPKNIKDLRRVLAVAPKRRPV